MIRMALQEGGGGQQLGQVEDRGADGGTVHPVG
jgi:hypothetical protein